MKAAAVFWACLAAIQPFAFAEQRASIPEPWQIPNRDRDRPGAEVQIPLYAPEPSPSEWMPPELERRDEPVEEIRRRPDLDELDEPPRPSKPDDRPIEPEPASKPAPSQKIPPVSAILAAQETVRSGNEAKLDALFGEDRQGAMDALVFVAKTMEPEPAKALNLSRAAERRMVSPLNDEGKQSFDVRVHDALAARRDLPPEAVRAVIESLLRVQTQAVNDPPELARKLLARAFPMILNHGNVLLKTLLNWEDMSASTARLLLDGLERAAQVSSQDVSRLSGLLSRRLANHS